MPNPKLGLPLDLKWFLLFVGVFTSYKISGFEPTVVLLLGLIYGTLIFKVPQ